MMNRAIKVALVVGTLLTFIHSGEAILAGQWPDHPWKIPLTYLVPFAVSLYSSAADRRSKEKPYLDSD